MTAHEVPDSPVVDTADSAEFRTAGIFLEMQGKRDTARILLDTADELDRLRAKVAELRDQRDAVLALAQKWQDMSFISSYATAEIRAALGVTE